MILNNINSSLLRFCSEFTETSRSKTLVAINFDAHGDDSTLPESDLIGIESVSVSVEHKFLNVKLMFGISTLDDTNLFRLSELTAEFFELVMPEKNIPLLDADTGEEIGWLKVQDGTTLLPVSGSMARPMKYFLVHLLSSVTV